MRSDRERYDATELGARNTMENKLTMKTTS